MNIPAIPSELLEPQLTKFFGLMIGIIGSEPTFPAKEKWQEWHLMFKGVHYFVIGNRGKEPKDSTGVHASLAFSNALANLDPCWAVGDKKFDESRALEIWKTCRQVHLNPPISH